MKTLKCLCLLVAAAILCAAKAHTTYLKNLDGSISAFIYPIMQIDNVRTDSRLTKNQRKDMLKEAHNRLRECRRSHRYEKNWIVTPDMDGWVVFCRKCSTAFSTTNHPFSTTIR